MSIRKNLRAKMKGLLVVLRRNHRAAVASEIAHRKAEAGAHMFTRTPSQPRYQVDERPGCTQNRRLRWLAGVCKSCNEYRCPGRVK